MALKLGLQLGYWQAQPPSELRRAGARGRAPRLRLGVDRRGVGLGRASRRSPGSARTPRASSSAPRSCSSRRARRPRPRWPRSPSTTSRSGRMILGLGVSGPQVVEGWYGQPFAKPLARTREYVSIVRQVLKREQPVRNDGPHYPLPYHGPGQRGARQAAALDHPPAARGHPDLPRRRGAEERRPRRRDRRRLAAALLLALPARGLRRVAAQREARLRDRGRRQRQRDRRHRRRPRAGEGDARLLHRRHGREEQATSTRS